MNEMVSQSSITIDIDTTKRNKEEHQGLKEKNEFERNIILAYQSLQSHSNRNSINQAQQFNSAQSYILSAYDSIALLNKKLVINNNVLDKLKRIASYGIQYQILIGKIYLQLFELNSLLLSTLNGSLIIAFINQVLNLLETVRTTSIEYPLEKKANEFISTLLDVAQLDNTQKGCLKQFMFDKQSNSKQIPKQPIDFSSFHTMLSTTSKSLEKIHSLEAQYELFIDNIDHFISLIQSTTSKEANDCEEYIQFGDVLMTMLFSESVVVLYQTDNENEQTNVVQFYNDIEQNIPFVHRQTFAIASTKDLAFLKEQLIPLALAFIQQFSAIEDIFEIQYISFMLLRRLYLLFPNYNPKFAGLLIKVVFCVCTFDNQQSEECRQLIRNIIEYSGTVHQFIDLKHLLVAKKTEVMNDPKIKMECNADYVVSEPFGVDGLLLLDYDLKVGMFNYLEIQSGETETIYIEISHAYSLVDFCVLINDLDITISFSYMKIDDNKTNNGNNNSQSEFKKIKQFDQVDIFDSPKKFLFFITSPGIIKVTLDNSYSWVKSKAVNYKSNVLSIANPFDILRTISIIHFNDLLSNQIDSSSFTKHSNKVIMFKLGTINKAFNAGKVLNNIIKYNNLLTQNEINKTLPIFIKGNIIWELGDAKNRRELTKDSFDYILNKNISKDNNKLTIIHLFNMSNEDKVVQNDIAEYLPFTLSDSCLNEHTILLRSNFIHCCLMLQIYYYVLDNKYVNDYLLFIHCGEFGYQLSGYSNGVIDYIPQLNDINNLTTLHQQSQLIADYYNGYDYPKKGGKANDKETIELFISGIKLHRDELANGLKKAQWNTKLEVIINNKDDDDFINEVIQCSHFFLFSD